MGHAGEVASGLEGREELPEGAERHGGSEPPRVIKSRERRPRFISEPRLAAARPCSRSRSSSVRTTSCCSGSSRPDCFDKDQEVELLETLRLEQGWRLQLLRVRRRGPLKTAIELERESRRIRGRYGLESFELVERRPRNRDYILLVRQRNPERLRRWLSLAGGEIPRPPRSGSRPRR